MSPSISLIYINDLPEIVNHSKIRLFADDCLSIDVYITNRIQNFYKKISMPLNMEINMANEF